MRARDTKVGGRYRFVIEGEVTHVSGGIVSIDTTETGFRAFDWNLFNDVEEIEPVQPKPRYWPPRDGDVWVSGGTAYLVHVLPRGSARFDFVTKGIHDSWCVSVDFFLRRHPDVYLTHRSSAVSLGG